MKAVQPKWGGEEEQPEKIDAEAFLRLKGFLEKMEVIAKIILLMVYSLSIIYKGTEPLYCQIRER